MVQPAQPVLAIVTPCFNEEAIIVSTVLTLTALMEELIRNHRISPKSFTVFVDDGSRDQTVSLLRSNKNEKVKILKLAGNVGHQQALLAGLHYVCNQTDCCISLDADLQDDTAVIATMVAQFVKVTHIVYRVRGIRNSHSPYK